MDEYDSNNVPSHLIETDSDRQAIKDGCWYDQTEADRVKSFLNKFCRLSIAPWNDKPIDLLLWQRNFIDSVYGWQIDADGRLERRFNRVRFFCGKKQGKSTFLSCLLLFHLFEQPRADCIIVAGTKEQAKIIFDEACLMIEAHPTLAHRLWVRRNCLTIEDRKADSKARILSSEPRNAAGHNPSFLVADEIASWGAYARETWSHLEPAGIARSNFLQIVIGHAGFQMETVGHELFRQAQSIQNSEIIDTRTYAKVHTVTTDPPDAWQKEEYWHQALPSLGKTVTLSGIKQQFKAIANNPAKEAEFRTLICNQFVGSAEAWLSQLHWESLGDPDLDLSDFEGEPCHIGLDLSKTTDLTAYTLVFHRDGKYHVFPKFFMPEEQCEKRMKEDKVPYRSWKNLTLTDGDVIDQQAVLDSILRDKERFRIIEIDYDPYGAELIRQKLEFDHSICMVPIPQQRNVMAPMVEQVHRVITEKRMVHPQCHCLNWCISNTKPKEVGEDRVILMKASHRSRIDGTIAMVMAMGRMMLAEESYSIKW